MKNKRNSNDRSVQDRLQSKTQLRHGFFIPKSERDNLVNMVRETHFSLGNEKGAY
jgi:hypothetical protein